MWDMHVHATVSVSNYAYSPDSIAAVHQANAVYRQLLANGVTGIRDAGSQVPLATYRVWKREIAAGRRVGPRLIVSGPFIDQGPEGIGCTRDKHAPPCDAASHGTYAYSPEDARYLVDSLQAAGADMIKAHDISSSKVYFAIAAEARRVGIPFGGHVPGENGLVVSDSGARILDHGEGISAWCGADTVLSLARCAAAAAQLRRNGTWLTLLGGPVAISQRLILRAPYWGPILGDELPAKDAKPWRPLSAAERRQRPSTADFAAALPDSVRHSTSCYGGLLMYAADVPVMPGRDWPMLGSLGVGVHTFMLQLVLCGVPPLWALRTATLNPALALRATDSLGTVAVGKVADLVLLEGDPLEDIWNVSKIAAVLANGRYFDRAALDRLLMEADAEWRTVAARERQAQEEQQKRAAQTQQPSP
jgi:hypothetical protein